MKKIFLFISILVPAISGIFKIAVAQNPTLVADVNTDTAIQTFPGDMLISGGKLFFNVKDNDGIYLWKSDGTVNGTVRVASPGFYVSPNSTHPPAGIDVNGILYYRSGMAATADGANRLWKTDGTQAGTKMLGDVQDPYYFIEWNGAVYFSGTDGINGPQLWKSDGTDAGTVPVKDIGIGVGAALSDKLVFSNCDDLYVSDGTAAGTYFYKNMDSSLGGSCISNMIAYNGLVYFIGNDGLSGYSLWSTDGSAAGTVMVKKMTHSANNDYSADLILVNGKLFFKGANLNYGYELWTSDGTEAGTVKVKDINPGAANALDYYTKLYAAGNEVYFYANDGIHGNEPWHSDGTEAGTSMVADLIPGSGSSTPSSFAALGSQVAFIAFNEIGTKTLYITNGTASGTAAVTELPLFFYPQQPVSYKGKVYLKYNLDDTWWVTNGTIAGTGELTVNTDQNGSSDPYQVIKISNDLLVFATLNLAFPGGSNELWSSHGTPSTSTYLMTNGEYYTEFNLCPQSLNGLVLFDALNDTINTGHALWKTDGTLAGTVLVKDIAPVFGRGSVVLNNILYFVKYSPVDLDNQLWRTDGTTAGTYLVKNIRPGGNDNVNYLTLYNNLIWFSANDGTHGSELWKSDGTAAGTVMAVDINPTDGSVPEFITSANCKLFFRATTDTYGQEPWVSDGTPGGTFMLKDIYSQTSKSSDPYQFTASGPFVYFGATNKNEGQELWRTDGTSAGTILVKDIVGGKESFVPVSLTDVNGTLYFTNSSYTETDGQLWKTNGDNGSTMLVYEDGGAVFDDLHRVSDDLYFTAHFDADAPQLIRTDGSSCHTQILDLFAEVADEDPDLLLVDDLDIYLALNSEAYGRELWKLTATPFSDIEICNGLDDDCDGIIDNNPVASIDPSGNIAACKTIPVTLTTDQDFNSNYQWLKNGVAIPGATNNSFTTNGAGNFQVAVSSSGCAATSTVTNINRLDNPPAMITPLGNLDICTTGFVDLQANAGIGFTYQWFKNNNLIAGATNQAYKAVKKGNYTVTVSNANDCSKTSKKVKVTSSCKESVLENAFRNSVTVFPNPASSSLNIRMEAFAGGRLIISNLLGEIIFIQPVTSNEFLVDVSSLALGVYLLKIETATSIITKKFEKN